MLSTLPGEKSPSFFSEGIPTNSNIRLKATFASFNDTDTKAKLTIAGAMDATRLIAAINSPNFNRPDKTKKLPIPIAPTISTILIIP